ncbi:hypothetical protein LTR84_003994 [Exophiala bonariae]|uniref:Transcription factor domain-containing protein n=1 Tax=Exophiala bonariae TaxID=1690606 RepID=A0AAV9N7W5_9EURO|nr:hypothetical protein LTR84_003994 [Exophiala bonariae]
MIAYAAVFLVKLLLCVPREMRSELEGITIDTIHATAQSFAQHSAPVKSSCWLQAKFLSNVLREFKEASRTRQPHPASIAGTSRYQQEPRMAMGHHSSHDARDATLHIDGNSNPSLQPREIASGDISAQHQHPHAPRPPPAVHPEYPQHPFNTGAITTSTASTTTTPILNTAPTSAPYPPPVHHAHQESHLHSEQHHQQHQQDFTFSDDAMWEVMFANAGFNITDGTFLLDHTAYDDYRARDGVGEAT